MASAKNRDLYNQHVQNCDPEDFWGQVKRTVNGEVISQDQIDMIVEAILNGADIGASDVLLDLCCGNGALTDIIFDRCRGGAGVDFSEELIDIAKRYFQRLPERSYTLADVEEYVSVTPDTENITKALCYGSFQLLSHSAAANVLRQLHTRFPKLQLVFIGNLPDKALMSNFFYEGVYVPGLEDDHESPVGIWRTESEFSELAASSGWNASFRCMPAAFHAAHYRYDAILTR